MTGLATTGRARRVLIALALYLSAVLLGLGLTGWVLRHVMTTRHTFTVGSWQINTLAGSTDADLYTRAGVAVSGLLALDRSETLYYLARVDAHGQPLRSRCSYRITGTRPAARWWSLTAYADDHFLFDAPNRQFSFSDAAGSARGNTFSLATGPAPTDGLFWLPTPGDRGLELTLRLYNPEPALQAAPTRLEPPLIEPVGTCA